MKMKLVLAAAFIPASAFLFMADQASAACPREFKVIDNALWEDARESGQPGRWVQYFSSQGCEKNKAEAKALLTPIFGSSHAGTGNAPSILKFSGKFSGDNSQTVEKATNGAPLKSLQGGGHLYTFVVVSKTAVKSKIPKNMYDGEGVDKPTGDTKNLALWIEYRCAVPGQKLSDWFGVPGKNEGQSCPSNIFPNVFDRVEAVLKGPYRNFFTLDCRKNEGVKCDEKPGEQIRQLTLTLKPKDTFSGLMAGGYTE